VIRGLVVPIIVVAVVVVALISISYPSVIVSNVRTQPLPRLATYRNEYAFGFPVETSSTFLAGYSSITAWYPGNPICDPTSNACTPFPTPTATFVYPQSLTYAYQVTLSSRIASIYASTFTVYSTQTSSYGIPPYAAAGLSTFQYGIVAMVIVMVLVLSLLFIFTRKRTLSGPRGQVPRLSSGVAFSFLLALRHREPSGKLCTRYRSRLE
jgi:hypothetical protein